MRAPWRSFTLLNLALRGAAPLLPHPGLVARATYLACWAVAASFYAARVAHPAAYPRMMIKLGVPDAAFHVGNAVLHLLPLHACYAPACAGGASLACAWLLGWGAAVTRGSMNLDAVYVPGPPWSRLWIGGVAAVWGADVAL